MLIRRTIEKTIRNTFKTFPVVVLTGPRQAGKTTLLKKLYKTIRYVSLEELDMRTFAQDDPRGFLATYRPPVILDEAQHTPDLFSYIQTEVDELRKPSQYILSGSQNFLLLERISQSLAGRAGILHLLPFTIQEVFQLEAFPNQYEQLLYKGLYPRIWDVDGLESSAWYRSYIQTYIERDVRSLKAITDLGLFQKFLKLCAGRTAQILNLTSLANDAGITHNTARSWLSVLEASFIVFLLKPYYRNFNKRIVKSPKLYFYDAGLASSLLGINSSEQISTHPLKGALFETLIVSELVKDQLNAQKLEAGYYFRDKSGNEIDYLFEKADRTVRVVEVKAGKTVSSDYFNNLRYWQELAKPLKSEYFVIYGGDERQKRKEALVLPWKDLHIGRADTVSV